MSEQRHASLGIHGLDPDTDPHALLQRRQIVRRAKWLTALLVVLLIVGSARTVISRADTAKSLEAGTAERAKNYVKTIQPKPGGAAQTLVLPATLQGYVQAPIASRAAGYLKRWTKDIGTPVTRGELLAEIETPEIDQQLSQAIAAREQAAASLALARTTVARWESLRQRDAVSQQDLEERRSTVAQQQANFNAAEANVQRLRQLEGFKRITAPFSGVITRRTVDVGDLIDAGAGNLSRPLFLLAQTDPLRVYVNVPQSYAQIVRTGQTVSISQAEIRGQKFTGEVVRLAGAIDPATRTMQVEVRLPNPDGALMPGAYVQVSFAVGSTQGLTVPTNTLLFRGEGLRVAVVDAAGTIKLRPLRIGRYFGDTVEVLEGIGAEDRLVVNPSDSLADGDKVELAPAAKAAPKS